MRGCFLGEAKCGFMGETGDTTSKSLLDVQGNIVERSGSQGSCQIQWKGNAM